jgi:hypothetical protein
MRILIAIILTAAVTCHAQVPVETGRPSTENLQRDQMKAGSAYREMQNAERATRDAEQDYRRAESVYKDEQKRVEEARQQTEAARKMLDAAKAKEAQTRKAYDAAVNSVGGDAQPSLKK